MKKPFSVLLPQAAALSFLAAFSLPAAAQSAGSNIVQLGWFHLYTDDSSDPLTLVQPPAGRLPGTGPPWTAPTRWGSPTRISSPTISP